VSGSFRVLTSGLLSQAHTSDTGALLGFDRQTINPLDQSRLSPMLSQSMLPASTG
jgi:hypothetical protein